MRAPLLRVRDLRVSYKTQDRQVQAVRNVSFELGLGETVALVGESGCGKTATAQAIMGLLPERNATCQGSILFEERELLTMGEEARRRVRGREIGMIFQDPMTSLNPTLSVGEQVAEGMRWHLGLSRREAMARTAALFEEVGIHEAGQRLNQFPHEFSGGMRQRVGIAIALACNPKLLIADEPTTALDVTIQAQILELLKTLQRKNGLSVLLITHDLAVVANTCDRVLVMYGGQVMEEGPVAGLFHRPAHPYTQALLASLPNPRRGRHQPLKAIWGTPPDLTAPPAGCPFFARCDHAMTVCANHPPPFFDAPEGERAACWLHHPYATARSAPA